MAGLYDLNAIPVAVREALRKSAEMSRAEIANLRGAIKRAGFEVMQTSGDWSLYDVSEKAKAAEAKELEVVNANVELEVKIAGLQSERKAALDCLGPDYTGEFDLPPDKQRPLDSLVSEVLSQRDEEIADLRRQLALYARDHEAMEVLRTGMVYVTNRLAMNRGIELGIEEASGEREEEKPTTPQCPTCGGKLETVCNPAGSMLNDHQFNSIKAGDYRCPACPDNGRAKKGGCYWWEREVKP